MDNTRDKKSPSTIEKNPMLFLLISLGIIFVLIYLGHYSHDDQENYDKRAIEKSIEQYEQSKLTVLSEELHSDLIRIIEARKECFSSQKSYDGRSATCKRAYVNEIVRLARNKIKSAPMRGLFIRAIRECPIAGSLCNGEYGMQEIECIEMEARCIEYCLDQYWRGGSFPDANTYTYKKNRTN